MSILGFTTGSTAVSASGEYVVYKTVVEKDQTLEESATTLNRPIKLKGLTISGGSAAGSILIYDGPVATARIIAAFYAEKGVTNTIWFAQAAGSTGQSDAVNIDSGEIVVKSGSGVAGAFVTAYIEE